jgi:hypothetical protein
VLVGQNKEDRAIATVFCNGESPAAFELRYRVNVDMLAQVYDDEKEWSKVQEAIRVAQLVLRTQKSPLEVGAFCLPPPTARTAKFRTIRRRSR